MSHYAPVVAVLVTMVLIAVILLSRFGEMIQDAPNERSMHDTPIPRFGGIGLMGGILSGWALMFSALTWWLLLPLIGLFVVSLLDDMHNLPVRMRLSVHFVAAIIFIVGSGIPEHGWLITLLALPFLVWMTNLYNFMDGADGLAGGMTLIGFSAYGVAALMVHDDMLAMMAFTVGAAAFGFLYFNSAPAKVFMGDSGAISLGFLAAALGAWGWLLSDWGAWFPLLVFSPFEVDASLTLLNRLWKRKNVTEAHREHYFQRLILMGWSHARLARAEYALMLCAAVSGLAFLGEVFPLPLFLAWIVIYLALVWRIEVAWKKWKQHDQVCATTHPETSVP